MAKKEASSRRRWIIGGVGIVGVAIVLGIVAWSMRPVDDTQYRERKVKRGLLETTIVSTGTVAPKNRLEIKPPIAGRAEDVLVNEGARVRKGQILAWMSSTERAALLDAARARGPEEVKRWEEFYRATPIIAPINGTVILRKIEPGQTFTSADAVLVIADRLIVEAQVDETDIAQVKPRQPARIVLDAYASSPIPGWVDALAYEAKMVNNVTTYTVDVQPKDIPPFMRAGMTANVYFILSHKDDVLLLPASAVRKRREESFVLIRDESGEPVEHTVETGATDGKNIEITRGLKEGDAVLVAQPKSRKKGNGGSNPFSMFGKRRK